jgi:hypothetical protein
LRKGGRHFIAGPWDDDAFPILGEMVCLDLVDRMDARASTLGPRAIREDSDMGVYLYQISRLHGECRGTSSSWTDVFGGLPVPHAASMPFALSSHGIAIRVNEESLDFDDERSNGSGQAMFVTIRIIINVLAAL